MLGCLRAGRRRALAFAVLALVLDLGACASDDRVSDWFIFSPRPAGAGAAAPPRVSGPVVPAPDTAPPQPRAVMGQPGGGPGTLPQPVRRDAATGDITLNFVDADIREVARVILGDFLKVTFTIDPAVKGSATIQTAQPVARTSLLPLLETVLAQNGASIVRQNDIYNVVPAATQAAAQSGLANIGELTEIVPLRFASAPELAKVLEPYVGAGGKIAAGPAKNSLVVSGSTSARQSLISLIRTFDVDFLAGQSYAIFPVASAEPSRVAAEVQRFVQAAGQGDAPGPVHVMPLDRISAILVVAPEARYLARVGDFLGQVEEVGDTTSRRLHVYYVQNGSAVELGAVLQRAFAPQNAAPGAAGDQGLSGSLAPGETPTAISTPQAAYAGTGANPGLAQSTVSPATTGLGGSPAPGTAANPAPPAAAAPLSALSPTGAESEGSGPAAARGIRIIPDRRNNALLIFATPSEYSLIEATLRKIDVLPLQVLVEATVAEVTLNDTLQYGTQFFFKQHHNSVTLSNVASGAVGASFPGFAYAFTSGDATVAISALQSVTKVKVISDPQLVVLDNQSARLQVGDIVPIATQSAVSVLTSGAPVVNSIEYRETGVILQVTPRVNSGGLVTLDIEQEVSQVVQTTTSNLNSPTIQQRKIRSRVVVQDGDTIGLGGLIKDNSTVSNQGVPWLTDIPVLGALFGTRNNTQQRTELLVLLTPRVVQDQRSARALTEDLRARLGRMGSIPDRRDPLEPPGPLRK